MTSATTMKRLKHICFINPSKSEVKLADEAEVTFVPMERATEDGVIRTTERRLMGEVRQGFTYFRDGDILVAKITPCFENGKGGHCIGLANQTGFGSTEFHVLRPRPGVMSRFLFYITRTHEFRKQGEVTMYGAAGQQRVPEDFVQNWLVSLPDLPTQQKIADYLDRKTAEIDALIAKKRRMIDLLHEKRQALISEAITRGLDPDVPMKDSALPGLGMVPFHWAKSRVKHLISFITSGSRGWAEYYSEEGDLFIQSGNLGRCLELDFTNIQRVTPPVGAEVLRTLVCKDDVLVCVTGAYTGNVAHVANEVERAFVNQHVALVRPEPAVVHPRFLAYLLHSSFGQSQLLMTQYGGTKQGLGLEDIREVVSFIPPLPEQIEIAHHLDEESRRCEKAVLLLYSQIDNLRVYRQTLVSDAVSGKIDLITGGLP